MVYGLAEEGRVPDAVRNAYDLVGFDPRGINGRTPVDCSEFIIENINEYPRELADLQTKNFSFVENCVEKYADYLQHLTCIGYILRVD